MATTISQNSIDTVTRLIEKEFNTINFKLDFIYGRSEELIKLADNLGLKDLAFDLSDRRDIELKKIIKTL